MYETAKKSRAANKAKAERLANRPIERVDSSDWTPPPLLNADVKTGMRPVSKQALKRGGKVHGEKTKVRADRVARKAGGRVDTKGEQPLVDRYINRDLKKANEYRDGDKHEGALKRGGRARKNDGGPTYGKNGVVPLPYKKATSSYERPDYYEQEDSANDTVRMMPIPAIERRKDKSGKPVEGAYKRGGRAHKDNGGGAMGSFKNKKTGKQITPAEVATSGFRDKSGNIPLPPRRDEAGMKKGGFAKLAKGTKNARAKHKDGGKVHSDVAADKKLIKNMVKPSAMKDKACYGGRMKKADGGPMGKDPRLDIVKPKAMEFGANMVTPGLKKGGRAAKAFGGPMTGSMPSAMGTGVAPTMPQMPTLPAQAMQNAQGRPFQDGQFMPPGLANRPAMGAPSGDMSTQVMPTVGAGAPTAGMPSWLTAGGTNPGGQTMPSQLFGGANPAAGAPAAMPTLPAPVAAAATNALSNIRPMGRAAGGRTKGKGKTNINIVIAQAPKDQDKAAMPPMPPAGPQGIPVPVPPAGGGAPPMPMGAPPMPPQGGAPRPSPFKKGGRVSKVAHSFRDMTAGAGSGEGRLQKTDIAERMPKKAGGKVYRSYKDMDAGAGSGFGRLEKTEIEAKKSRKG